MACRRVLGWLATVRPELVAGELRLVVVVGQGGVVTGAAVGVVLRVGVVDVQVAEVVVDVGVVVAEEADVVAAVTRWSRERYDRCSGFGEEEEDE